MSPADKLLPHLERVRACGPERWIARCPAHDDGSPSLAIRELADGRLLLRCFAGCDVAEVVAAIGLELADLFPPRPSSPGSGSSRERRPFSAGHLIELAAEESAVAGVVVADLVAGREDADVDRLIEAGITLGAVAEAVHGYR